MTALRARLNATAAAALLGLLPYGCASPKSAGYFSTYDIAGSRPMDGESAEKAVVAAVASASGARSFDKPISLLRAPQPVMSTTDTDERVVGQVVVDIQFNEAGFVEHVTIVSSTKQSLSETVLAAVSKWQMVPATRGGRAQRVTARQTFTFQTAR